MAQGPRGTLWAEQSMWSFLAKEMAQPLIDEGVAKLTPEFLVHGKAFPPQDTPTACAVRARFAGCEKTLLAFGDRYWDGDRASAPRPFESMPIDWSQAYGGADFAQNPHGRGRITQDGVAWLPNIESPHERLLRPDEAIAPAGFGALDSMAPQRAVKPRHLRRRLAASTTRPGFPAIRLALLQPGPAGPVDGRAARWRRAFPSRTCTPIGRSRGRLPGLRPALVVRQRDDGQSEPKVREVPCT